MRGLGALVVMALLLAGVPITLYQVGGSPLPHTLPTWSQVTTALTQPDTDNTLFLGAVRIIGWAAWCLFVATTLTEAAGYLAGRPTPRLPGPIRPMQHLARDLVAMAALTFSTAAPITSPAAAPITHQTATADPALSTPATASTTAKAAAPTSHDTSAPATSGAAHRPERRPWHIRLIKRGDTMWGIARRHYGSGTHYPKIFKASKDLKQPDGLPGLSDPDEIYPGQRVKIPHPTKGPERSPSPTEPPSAPPEQPRPPEREGPPSSTATPAPTTPRPTPRPTEPTPAPSPPQTGTPGSTSQPAPSGAAPSPTGPATAPPTRQPTHTPPTPSAAPTSTAPQAPGDRNEPFAVTLPTGAYIGLGLAAAVSLALAATRLHRRRRRPHTQQWPRPAQPEPPPPPAVATARKAHLDTYADRGEPIPSDADLVAADLTTPTPTHITIGVRNDQNLTLPLAGLSLGLDGPGAPDVARAIATELLARSHRYRVELVIPQPDAHTLFADTDVDQLADAAPGLVITPSLKAAIVHLEAEFVHRARLMQTTDDPDVPSLRTTEPGEPLPAIVIIASVPQQTAPALQAILQLGRPYCVGGLLLGEWPAGTTLRIAPDATITRADGPDADTLAGTRLFHLGTAEAAQMLATIRTAHGAPDPPAPAQAGAAERPDTGTTDRQGAPAPHAPDNDAANNDAADNDAAVKAPPHPPRPADQSQQRPVQLHLLGPIRLEAAQAPITTGLRRSARDLLVYLALHPDGITREQGIDALWPNRDLEAGTPLFHTSINNIRKNLRNLTGLREPMFVIHAGGRYRLDPHLIEVDLWTLLHALDQAHHATTDTDRLHALQQVPELYTAELTNDLTYEWAETHRENLRRTATDALVHLARLTQQEHPDQAVAVLEQALHHDPYSEPLYRSLMRLQARLGHPDAVRRTHQLLTNRLAEIDLDPDEQTHQLLTTLLHQPPRPPHHQPENAPPTRTDRAPQPPSSQH
ncbi:BTAD domain-containing putative transcriptional regulator [Actinomadura sp. SCN-SB]|uniref:BTAD domain-containing putative transcriptional regulator n=1 Tax=Actinomadura sp. SCN-SB TaxID=3373092 RepID=UPI0037510B3C